MLNAGPDVQPNSAEKAFDCTDTSCTAPTGTVAIIVCRPQPSSLLAPSSMYVVVRRLPEAVTKYVALTKRSPVPLPWRKAELKSGKLVDLAAEDRRRIDNLGVDAAADLRVRAHALIRAVHGHLARPAGRDQPDLYRHRLAGTQGEIRNGLAHEPSLRDADLVVTGQRQRAHGRRAIVARHDVACCAGRGVHDRHLSVRDDAAKLIHHGDDNRRRVGCLRGRRRRDESQESENEQRAECGFHNQPRNPVL